MRAEALAIGTELLTTGRLDTNTVWLAQRLADLGLAFHRKTCAGDDPGELAALFREALERSELIVTSGGLGPTFDDLTKEVWAEVLGVPLEEDPQVRTDIEGFFRARGRPLPPRNLKQALIPRGARVLRNALGTAPGLVWDAPPGYPRACIVMLPGVPRELKHLWTEQVEPLLRPRSGAAIHTLRILVAGVGESLLEQRIQTLREAHRHLDWTILAGLGTAELLLRDADPQQLREAKRDLELALGEDRVLTGWGTLEGEVVHALAAREATLATAESMTGGRVGALLTTVPGASSVYLGGAVAYSPQAKHLLADVGVDVLDGHGTVSEATALALAEGIRARLGAVWGLATVGNAGPTEDPQGPAPVGTCVVAAVGPGGPRVTRLFFPGERPDVQARSATLALDWLRRCLQDGKVQG